MKLILVIAFIVTCFPHQSIGMPVCQKQFISDLMTTIEKPSQKDICLHSKDIVDQLTIQLESSVLLIPDTEVYFHKLTKPQLIETKRVLMLLRDKVKWILTNVDFEKCQRVILKWVDRVAMSLQVLSFALVVLSTGLSVAGMFLTPAYGVGVAITVGSMALGLISAGLGVGTTVAQSTIHKAVKAYYKRADNYLNLLRFFDEYIRVSNENIDLKLLGAPDDSELYSFPSEGVAHTFYKYHDSAVTSLDFNNYETRLRFAIANNLDVDDMSKQFLIDKAECYKDYFVKTSDGSVSKPTVSILARNMLTTTNPKCCWTKSHGNGLSTSSSISDLKDKALAKKKEVF